ncbi:MAG: hypothetical protein ACR2NB_13800 [Solirubrobacteraceae bacterium]
MNARATVRLLGATTVLSGSVTLGAVAAPVQTGTAAAVKVTAAGVGKVGVGKRYSKLRAAGLLGPQRKGCELSGKGARAARLRAPLKGSVGLTRSKRRRVRDIVVTGGATARGVGIGASRADITAAFPKARFDSSTEEVFDITLVKVPKGGGGRLQFALDTATKKVTLIGVPFIAFCE